jgi:hypothetical protein
LKQTNAEIEHRKKLVDFDDDDEEPDKVNTDVQDNVTSSNQNQTNSSNNVDLKHSKDDDEVLVFKRGDAEHTEYDVEPNVSVLTPPQKLFFLLFHSAV